MPINHFVWYLNKLAVKQYKKQGLITQIPLKLDIYEKQESSISKKRWQLITQIQMKPSLTAATNLVAFLVSYRGQCS